MKSSTAITRISFLQQPVCRRLNLVNELRYLTGMDANLLSVADLFEDRIVAVP